MPRLLAFLLALLFWPQQAGESTRAAVIEAWAGELTCVVVSRGNAVGARKVGAERVLLESEPDRGSRAPEGRHAPPCAPFRTVLCLASEDGCHAGEDASRQLRHTIPVYFATAPPRAAWLVAR